MQIFAVFAGTKVTTYGIAHNFLHVEGHSVLYFENMVFSQYLISFIELSPWTLYRCFTLLIGNNPLDNA